MAEVSRQPLSDEHVSDDLAALEAFMAEPRAARTGPDCGAAAHELTEALGTRSVVDQATGLLMTGLGYDAFEAFDLLRLASRDSDRAVGEVAQGLVDSEARARHLCTSAS